jgi:nicotinate phosphoribosyltransferase
VFAKDFLDWLRKNCSFDGISLQAIPEGRVVHPNAPLTVVQGPLAMAQILETSLLNHINYQTLIATKAARIHESGRGQLMLEFGLRRGQEKGANAGTRAALIGGADYSSNVGISHVLGLPPKGTHAHSMVQLYMALGEGELEAFRAYAEVYPDNCLLLVDTINTLESGIPNAIRVFEELRRKGFEPVGVRLDSGDLAYLSIQAAKMLDQAGFPDTIIVLSNNLDELVIWQIITQIQEEAPRYGMDADHLIKRLVYGVGTRLIVSQGDPALDGVYKLVAVHDQGQWKPAIKISNPRRKRPIQVINLPGGFTINVEKPQRICCV